MNASTPQTDGRWYPRWLPWMVGIAGLIIAAAWLPARWLPAIMHDRAVPNVLTTAMVVLVVLMWSVWLALFSNLSWRVRWWPLLGVAVLGLLAATAVRVDEVWGGLIPHRVSWRWNRARDYDLERLASSSSAVDTSDPIAGVDLASSAKDFPEFLGAGRRNAVDNVRLIPDWDQRPPRLLWKHPIGAGWSGFVAADGMAITMEQRGDEELVTCYDIETGDVAWAVAEPTRHSTSLGGIGPRATPTIHDGRVYALGATGILHCIDGRRGGVRWRVDLLKQFGISSEGDQQRIAWGRATSPLAIGDKIIVPVGGDQPDRRVSLAAFDAKSGEVVWQGGHRQAAYASPSLVELGGQRQILVVLEDFVAGHDIESGRVLWEHPWPGSSSANANVSQAWAVDDRRVFVSKGYGQGCMVFAVSRGTDGESSEWSTETLWANPAAMKTKFTNPTIWEGHAYGLDDGVLSCVALESGKRTWKKGRFGHGQLLRVQQWLLVQSEAGEIALVEATPDEYREVARFEALQGKCWNTLCLYGDRLLLRNGEMAACYELPIE